MIGVVRTKAAAVLDVLTVRNIRVPAKVANRIRRCTDPAQVDGWYVRALTATNLAGVLGD